MTSDQKKTIGSLSESLKEEFRKREEQAKSNKFSKSNNFSKSNKSNRSKPPLVGNDLTSSARQGPEQRNQKSREEILCRCNNITRNQVEEAIRDGAHTLNQIFDTTTAGVGSCGGSCRRKLRPLLQAYLDTGEFPLITPEDDRGPSDKT